ncbi:MAG: hypothetical protein MJ175_12805 [Clostridia bacterium]|nr:hypothetical protein [Clostridia bacterium]
MKHTKKIRVFAGLLALLAAGSTLAACGDAATTPQTQETKAQQTEAVTDSVEPAETVFPMPTFPEKDYGGRDFTFLTSDQNDDNGVDWVTKDIYAESATGDIVTDAVYERNLWMEETFNIKIKEFQCVTMSQTKKAVQAGVTDYDAVVTAIANGCNLGAGNFVLDLQQVPYIDLTQIWWDQGVTAGTSIGGRTYIATGDITIVDNDATWTLMFNKQMATDLDYNFYQMVADNKWDMETFYDCAKSAVKDLDGDGKMTGPADQFGFATSDQSSQGLMYAAGVMLSKKDASDYPIIDTDLGYLAKVVEKAGAIMSDTKTTAITTKNGITTSDDLRLLFEGGRALFFGEVMQCVTRMRESTTDFGLIPFPKFDVSQDRYYHFVHKTAGKGVCILSSQPDPEMAGLIIEAMAAKSIPTVTNAYYDKALTYKYMRDEESAQMLDIILSTRVYDLAYIYDWGGIFNAVFSQISGGKTEVASSWNKKLASANKALNKTIDAYKENE